MRIYLKVTCAVLPILVGVALGETTVAAMAVTPNSETYAPPPEQQDRYAMGQSWAAKHHPEGASACPAIDDLFLSGCVAATHY